MKPSEEIIGQDAAHVWALIEKLGPCMLATHEGGLIRARPMAPRPHPEENAIFFLTDARGDKDDEIAQDSAVALIFAHPGAGTFLTVTGQARIVEDRTMIRELWTRADAEIWTDSEDPGIRIIEVTPLDAQYWERPHGVIGTAQTVLAAAAGGMPLLGEVRKVDLH